ncbi:TIGR03086 family metal-binding protein [Planotetraspora mira]|uniref:TIGR03086 family protein n=1 Tax=Planotetraspora mira TaxID=58121 RepID=A0A8J3TUP1_9ACTN|nr:TIGR03086 family metal-binding protein [Planotetraspora mira]GII27555.1 TIGR03086 family protein [Planotetraspora mira]
MNPSGGLPTIGALDIALDSSAGLVRRITASQLHLITPNPGWTVRDVIGHSIGVTLKFAAFAAGATDQPRTPKGDLVGADHHRAFEKAVQAAKVSWAGADLSRTCFLPFGEFSADLAAGINLFDLLAHGWDLEAAVGAEYSCPDEVWAVGLKTARQVIGKDRDPRHYAPELATGADPTIRSQFLRFLGRQG